MSRVVSRDFDTRAEAEAFREGLQAAPEAGRARNARINSHAVAKGLGFQEKTFVSWDEPEGRKP